MTWAIIIIVLMAAGGIYAYAKNKGERKKAQQVSEHERELDEREIKDELEDKRNSDAWDNLNDTLDDTSG